MLSRTLTDSCPFTDLLPLPPFPKTTTMAPRKHVKTAKAKGSRPVIDPSNRVAKKRASGAPPKHKNGLLNVAVSESSELMKM